MRSPPGALGPATKRMRARLLGSMAPVCTSSHCATWLGAVQFERHQLGVADMRSTFSRCCLVFSGFLARASFHHHARANCWGSRRCPKVQASPRGHPVALQRSLIATRRPHIWPATVGSRAALHLRAPCARDGFGGSGRCCLGCPASFQCRARQAEDQKFHEQRSPQPRPALPLSMAFIRPVGPLQPRLYRQSQVCDLFHIF